MDDGRWTKLCVADKLAAALEPWWLYLPRVILSGEIREYMDRASVSVGTGNNSGNEASKYKGEPNSEYVIMQLRTGTVRGWHWGMTAYLRDWAMRIATGVRIPGPRSQKGLSPPPSLRVRVRVRVRVSLRHNPRSRPTNPFLVRGPVLAIANWS